MSQILLLAKEISVDLTAFIKKNHFTEDFHAGLAWKIQTSIKFHRSFNINWENRSGAYNVEAFEISGSHKKLEHKIKFRQKYSIEHIAGVLIAILSNLTIFNQISLARLAMPERSQLRRRIQQKARIAGFSKRLLLQRTKGLELHSAESSCAGYSSSWPAFALRPAHCNILWKAEDNNCDGRICSTEPSPACAQVLWKLRVIHLCVATLAQVWVVRPELLVALVQKIDLGESFLRLSTFWCYTSG